MDALWVKKWNGLYPADLVTENLLDGYKTGDYVRTDPPRKTRNPKHHRLMMAMLAIVVEHTYPRFADVDQLIKYLKVRSGRLVRINLDGVEVLEFESISFAAMDQVAFKALCDQWLAIICDKDGLMPGIDPEELLKEAA